MERENHSSDADSDTEFDELLADSSFGTFAARSIRGRANSDDVDQVRNRANAIQRKAHRASPDDAARALGSTAADRGAEPTRVRLHRTDRADADPEIERVLVTLEEKRVQASQKAAKKKQQIRRRAELCGGSLQSVAYSSYDGFLVITTTAFYDPVRHLVVERSTLTSVEISLAMGVWVVLARVSGGAPAVVFRFQSASEAYTVQALLGFD